MKTQEFKVLVRKDTGDYQYMNEEGYVYDSELPQLYDVKTESIPSLKFALSNFGIHAELGGCELQSVILLTKEEHEAMEKQLMVFRLEEITWYKKGYWKRLLRKRWIKNKLRQIKKGE